jgi:hypothetical protein
VATVVQVGQVEQTEATGRLLPELAIKVLMPAEVVALALTWLLEVLAAEVKVEDLVRQIQRQV